VDEVDAEPLGQRSDRGADSLSPQPGNSRREAQAADVVHGNAVDRTVRRQAIAHEVNLVSSLREPARPAGDVDRARIRDSKQT
jgi:hypothetical protein